MIRSWALLALFVFFASPCRSQELNKLPIRRVILYKNGVGYFEHLGRVRDIEDVAISFTSGQLNDVLKSLTVLDLDGGRILGVGYGSATPAERQLGELRFPVGPKATLSDFLEALRGARVEIRSGGTTITGRILSLETSQRIVNNATQQVDTVSVIGDSGDLRSVELTPAVSIRLLDRGWTGKVGQYLDIVAAAHEPDVRRMVIATDGSGERSLFVSYISETPVWKTTYRIVLGPKKAPLLQGWAIVDNTVGEDWNNVELSLVAGAPQSFIQNLSQPFFAHREVVPFAGAMNMTPQTYEGALFNGGPRLIGKVTDPSGSPIASAAVKAYGNNGALISEARTDGSGTYSIDGVPEGAVRVDIESPGFQRMTLNSSITPGALTSRLDASLQVGSTNQTVSVTSNAVTVAAPGYAPSAGLGSGAMLGSSTRLGSGSGSGSGSGVGYGSGHAVGIGGGAYSIGDARARTQAAALAQQLGDLFEYKVKQPISIAKNRSALVPIVQSDIEAEKISIWNEQYGLPRPQRALWLKNSSGLTLDGGTFSVIEDEAFAGEGLVDPIRPGEKRIISYAMDLALITSSKFGSEQQRFTHVTVAKGIMVQSTEVREKKTYTVRNEDTSPRAVIIEHPVRTGYELRGDARPVETTPAWMRFRLPVDAKETAMLTVEEARPVRTTYALTNLTSDLLVMFLEQKSIDKNIEVALRGILAQKDAIQELDNRKEACESETKEIFDDQQRLRENIKALKGSAEERALLQRYTHQLDEEENRLESLRKQTAQLETKITAAQSDLDRTIESLTFDAAL